ncbi:MAG: MerR family transcriptional regulator [Deltaproteobacteria bacterium]|nr:MerR family transcriptional regulator [Deltaproteobacteria bacterium]
MTAARRRTVPNKLYFRIGEVSDIVGVKPYVLRYWETEFSDIRPTKSKSGQRLYKRRDVELLLMIRELLYDERYTIDGAKQRLRELLRGARDGANSEQAELYTAPAPTLPVAAVAASAAAAPMVSIAGDVAVPAAALTASPPEGVIPGTPTRPVVPILGESGGGSAARRTPVAPAARSHPPHEGERSKLLIKLKSDLQGLLQELRT